MKDYILKRPMLLCAVICVIISIMGYYSKAAIIAFGIFYAFFIGVAVFKGAKPQILVALVLAFVMFLSLFSTLFKAEASNSFAEEREIAEAVVCRVDKESEEYNLAIMEIKDSNNLPRGTRIRCIYENKKLNMGQRIKPSLCLKLSRIPLQRHRVTVKIFLFRRMLTE